MEFKELIKVVITIIIIVLVAEAGYGMYNEVADPLTRLTFSELSQSQQTSITSSFDSFAKRMQECRDKQSTVKCACKDVMIKLPLDLKDHIKIKIVKHVNNSEIDLFVNDQSAKINKSIKFTQFSYMNSKEDIPKTKELFVTEELIDFKKGEITFYYFNGEKTKEITTNLVSPHIIKAAQYNSILSFAADTGLSKEEIESMKKEFDALPAC